MECAGLFAGQPYAIFLHPFAQRLTGHFKTAMFGQHLSRLGRPEVCVALFDQAQRVVTVGFVDLIVR